MIGYCQPSLPSVTLYDFLLSSEDGLCYRSDFHLFIYSSRWIQLTECKIRLDVYGQDTYEITMEPSSKNNFFWFLTSIQKESIAPVFKRLIQLLMLQISIETMFKMDEVHIRVTLLFLVEFIGSVSVIW